MNLLNWLLSEIKWGTLRGAKGPISEDRSRLVREGKPASGLVFETEESVKSCRASLRGLGLPMGLGYRPV